LFYFSLLPSLPGAQALRRLTGAAALGITPTPNELGPPDRQIRLSNGATEFRWFLQPAADGANMNRTGITYNGINNGFGAGPNTSPAFSNRYLQLTFDANGVLTLWSKNY